MIFVSCPNVEVSLQVFDGFSRVYTLTVLLSMMQYPHGSQVLAEQHAYAILRVLGVQVPEPELPAPCSASIIQQCTLPGRTTQ